MYMYKRYRQSDAVWFDSDWAEGGGRGCREVRESGLMNVL